ncbi:MAG TPA: sigma-70 family RNA polymerase sigma factor [Thermoanaerobaculia bacterium]|nr:sigma-70 family RNA polymerase sigma factor [Thermoanaerobaculia bacterium]
MAAGSSLLGGESRRLAKGSEAQEAELLAALAAGDRAAAERLLERTYRGVFALLRRLCGDSDLAADLTQETYRKAWTALPGFNGQSLVSTWLARIAYNSYLNHLRRPHRLVPLEGKHEALVRDPAPTVDETIAKASDADRLRRAVVALPEELRHTVTALFWGERSVRELALEEGITGPAVRKRLKRALQALGRALEEGPR